MYTFSSKGRLEKIYFQALVTSNHDHSCVSQLPFPVPHYKDGAPSDHVILFTKSLYGLPILLVKLSFHPHNSLTSDCSYIFSFHFSYNFFHLSSPSLNLLNFYMPLLKACLLPLCCLESQLPIRRTHRPLGGRELGKKGTKQAHTSLHKQAIYFP